jgi:hypothetical protein
MASKQSYELVDLFKRISGAIAANANMSMRERRAVMEHLGDATAEPRSVDFERMTSVPAAMALGTVRTTRPVGRHRDSIDSASFAYERRVRRPGFQVPTPPLAIDIPACKPTFSPLQRFRSACAGRTVLLERTLRL